MEFKKKSHQATNYVYGAVSSSLTDIFKPILPPKSKSANARQLHSRSNVGENQNVEKIENREPVDNTLYYPMKYDGNKKKSESENARQHSTEVDDRHNPSRSNVGENRFGEIIENREPSISVDNTLYYPMKYDGNKKVGRGIIIVNETFDELPNREGADKDCEYFREIYDKLKINYENNDFYNVNEKEMDKNIESFVKDPQTQNSSAIFVAISSHGSNDGLISGTSGKTNLGKIFAYFDQYKLLRIPKVFLIQACRGPKVSKAQRQQEHDGFSSSPKSRESSNYATDMSDTLIAYATGDGHTAWRDRVTGSWFVKDLRDCIMDRRFDGCHLADLLTICTNRVISTHCEGVTEIPSYQSTLRRRLLFPFTPVTS